MIGLQAVFVDGRAIGTSSFPCDCEADLKSVQRKRTFAKVFNPFALTSDAQLTSRFAALAEDSFQTSSMACYLQTIVAHVAAK